MTSLSGARVATCLAAVAVVGGSGALFASPARADDAAPATQPSAELAVVAPEPDVDAALGAVPASDPPAAVDAAVAEAPEPTVAQEPTGGADTAAAVPTRDTAGPATPTAVGTPESGFFTPPPPPAEPTAAGTPEGGFFTSPSSRRATPTVVATPEGTPQLAIDPPRRPIDTAIRPHIGVDTTPPQRATGRPRAAGATGVGDGAPAATASDSTDTAAPHSDTSLDTGASAVGDPTQPRLLPSTTQTSPSNVNVSVRIGSPGDAGPVTQVNLAAVVSGGATGTLPLAGGPLTLGDAVAGAAPVASGPTAGSSSTAGSGTTSSAAEGAGTWSWQWDCLSAPDFTAISSGGSGTGYLPTNWTWIWNCGDNPGQYQGAASSQYRPSNVNVSIRIASPGADGPVTQSNIAVAVGSSAASHTATTIAGESTSAIPTIPGLPSLPVPDVPAITAAVAASVPVLAPAVTLTAPLTELGVAAIPVLPGPAGWIDEPLDLPFVPTAVERTLVLPPFGPVAPRLAPGRAGFQPAVDPTLGVGVVGAQRAIGALTSGEASGRASATRSNGGRARDVQRPQWHAPAPTPVRESAPFATSAAPATGGGSSSGGIPIFLALPFLAAMLDLARRVVLDGTALPSGHRSRMPDDPG